LIKIQKKPSYNFFIFLFLFYLCIILSFYFFRAFLLPALFIFFLPHIFILFYLIQNYRKKKIEFILKIQKLEESRNLTCINIEKLNSSLKDIKEEIENYKSLRKILENVNQKSDLNNLADLLLESIFNLIAKGKGSCILYLVESDSQRLAIFATKKQDPQQVIRAKEGDVFDFWVLKHNCPLLVEDTKSDFRFDFEIVKKTSEREIGSLISAPLLSQERFLGIIRIDNPQPFSYKQQDLRLLSNIADFSSVAVENIKLLEQIKELAIKDELTLCFSKNYFIERLKEELSIKNQVLSLLMLDIDHFKDYNDKFGHIAGDIILRELGQLLNKKIESKGMVFRFGGEEFCILLPAILKKEAVNIAQDIIKEIRNKVFFLRQQKTSITVSMGLAVAPEDAVTLEELVFKADYYLYQAKQKGRDRLCYSQ